MTYTFDGENYVIVLKKGEYLIASLKEFIAQTNFKSGWVNGLGAAMGVKLGYYNLGKKEYQWQVFEQLCEIVSLTGNIARDSEGQPAFHFHGVFSDEMYQTIGGHVQDLRVGGTCELFVRELGRPLRREFDGDTGLKTLSL